MRCWRRTKRPASTSTALAQQLQTDGAKSFVASWQDLLKSIGSKSKALA